MTAGSRTRCLISLLTVAVIAPSAYAERTTLNGVELDFLVAGEGPPVYLLHGGMESRDNFKMLSEVLAPSFTVVAPDSREQGRSGPSDLQISYDLMAADVLSLTKHLGHDRISIVGLSDGGITALTFALTNPERVQKLVLIGTVFHHEAYSPETRNFIATYEWDGNTDPNTYPGQFIRHYLLGREDLSGFASTLKEMSNMWITGPNFSKADLARIDSEALVINGDRNDVPLEHALALYDGLPHASLFVVPGGSHYSLDEKPDLLNPTIDEFLRSRTARNGEATSRR